MRPARRPGGGAATDHPMQPRRSTAAGPTSSRLGSSKARRLSFPSAVRTKEFAAADQRSSLGDENYVNTTKPSHQMHSDGVKKVKKSIPGYTLGKVNEKNSTLTTISTKASDLAETNGAVVLSKPSTKLSLRSMRQNDGFKPMEAKAKQQPTSESCQDSLSVQQNFDSEKEQQQLGISQQQPTDALFPSESKAIDINKLRHSLRATLSPSMRKAPTEGENHFEGETPSADLSTDDQDFTLDSPNWDLLLQKELDVDEVDESLLFSPQGVQKVVSHPANNIGRINQKANFLSNYTSGNQHIATGDVQSDSLALRPTEKALKGVLAKRAPKLGPPQRIERVNKYSISRIAAKASASLEIESPTITHSQNTEHASTSANPSVRFADEYAAGANGDLAKPITSTKNLETNVSATVNPKQDREGSPERQPLIEDPYAIETLLQSAGVVSDSNKPWSQIMPMALGATQSPPSPFTPGKAGICLDLSNMFSVASTPGTGLRDVQTAKTGEGQSMTVKKSHREKEPHSPKLACVEKEEWAEKQCEMFTNWLNYTLLPLDECEEMPTNADDVDAESRAALRTLKERQLLAQSRLKAFEVFNGSEMKSVRKAIDSEIARGRMSIREDKNLYANVTLRKQILSLLFSYSSPWLQLGLEAMFGEFILSNMGPHKIDELPVDGVVSHHKQAKNGTGGLKTAMKSFITNRLLSDSTVLAKYSKGRCKVPSGKFGVKYEEEIRQLTLQRLLTLFVFLDRAKAANILDKYPCLFVVNSNVKSTKDVLVSFCRDFLKAEGNVIKHLSRVGIQVFYEQDSLEELKFKVTNIAVDLRDGVRLARLAEIISGAQRKSLLGLLRLPAVSRLQKLHNCELVIDTLRGNSIPLSRDIFAYHLVDGHRDVVLKVMWTLLFERCLKKLLDVGKVELEINRITRAERKCRKNSINDIPPESSSGSNINNDLQTLQHSLLNWSALICSMFGAKITNLTDDFADGKPFCYLIHYYHPNILHLREIKQTSRDMTTTKNDFSGVNEQALANERFNSCLANARMTDLGGMPKMIPSCDTKSPPEEKSMLMCLTFMCSRLIESHCEVRSSVLIQRRYRKYQQIKQMEKKKVAAQIIARTWHEQRHCYYETQRRKYVSAVHTIEKFILGRRGHLEQLKADRLMIAQRYSSALIIQKQFRRHSAETVYRAYIEKTGAAVTCQTFWRRASAQLRFNQVIRRHRAATLIQLVIRDFILSCSQRAYAAIHIQRVFRGWSGRVVFTMRILDIIDAQRIARGWIATRKTNERLRAVQVIQLAARRYIAIKTMSETRKVFHACVMIQCHARSLLARVHYSGDKKMIVTCQSHVRRVIAQLELNRLRNERAALKIQSAWRMFLCRMFFIKQRFAFIRVQAWARLQLCRIEYQCAIKRVTAIQSFWRRFHARMNFQDLITKIVCIQSTFRMMHAKRVISLRIDALSSMQCAFRCALARKTIRLMAVKKRRQIMSAQVIQRIWIGSSAARKFQYKRKQTVMIQTFARRWLLRHSLSNRRKSIVIIQSSIRKSLAMSAMTNLKKRREESSALIQTVYRGYKIRDRTARWNKNAAMIQKIYRGYVAMNEFKWDCHDIILSQTMIRCHLAKLARVKREAALLSLQACSRRFLAQLKVKRIRRRQKSSTKLQSLFRGYLARSWAKRELKARKIQRCCIKMQCIFRRYLARTWAKRELAARKIQSILRAFSAQLDYLLKKLGAIEFQAAFRRYKSRCEYWRRLDAVDRIHRFAAVLLFRRQLATRRTSAVLIQSVVRMHLLRSPYKIQKAGAVEIQRRVRGIFGRNILQQGKFAACEIQKLWRGYVSFAEFNRLKHAVIRVQAKCRGVLAKKYVQDLRNLYDYCSVKISHAIRQYALRRKMARSASIIQRAFKAYLTKLTWTKFRRGVIKLQGVARSQRIRKRSNRKLKSALKRIEAAQIKAERDPKRRLGNRAKNALHFLLKTKRLTQIMSAIETLEFATRHSQVCCNLFVEAGAPDILFQLIQSCNRSLPHQEIVRMVLLTFRNTAKHEKLLHSMATETGVKQFMNLVQLFREMDEMFNLATTLMEQCLNQNEELKKICSSQEHLRRLNGVYNINLRNRGKAKELQEGNEALGRILRQINPSK